MTGPRSTPPFPIDDPQFWLVTAAALCAAIWLVWKLFPKRLLRRKPGASTRATLTVRGRPVGDKRH